LDGSLGRVFEKKIKTRVFYRAGGALDEVGDNEISIKNNETFDDVVLRMAYWIVLTKAIDYYNQLVKEEIIND